MGNYEFNKNCYLRETSVFGVIGVETGKTMAKEITRKEEKQIKQLKGKFAYMKRKQEKMLQNDSDKRREALDVKNPYLGRKVTN